MTAGGAKCKCCSPSGAGLELRADAVQAVLKGAAAEGRCTAGEEVAVQLQLRDQYGAAGAVIVDQVVGHHPL